MKAKSLDSAQSLFDALRRFDPALEGSASEGYSVSVDVGANDRRLLDVLDAIQQHVRERDDAARVELDGKRYTVYSAYQEEQVRGRPEGPRTDTAGC